MIFVIYVYIYIYKKASLGLLLLCREMSSCLGPVVVGSQAQKGHWKFCLGGRGREAWAFKPPVGFLISRKPPSVFCCCAGRCHHAWVRLLLDLRLKKATFSILSRTLRRRTCRNFQEYVPCSRRYAWIQECYCARQGEGKGSCTNLNQKAGSRCHTNDVGGDLNFL